MATGRAGGRRSEQHGSTAYIRHHPEQTLLYRLIEEHYPRFVSELAEHCASLRGREFQDYLECGCLKRGGLRLCCETCHRRYMTSRNGRYNCDRVSPQKVVLNLERCR